VWAFAKRSARPREDITLSFLHQDCPGSLLGDDDKDRQEKKKWGENKCKKERKLYSDGLLRSDEPINGASELPDR
jgi:hypothetical protein